MKSVNNLVILTPGFAADETDTTAIPSLQLLIRAYQANYPELNIHVVAFQYPFVHGNYFWHGIPVYSAGGKNGKINRMITWCRVLIRLFTIHRKNRIGLLHSFWLTETTLIGLLFCFFTRVRFLATAMGQDVRRSNRYLRILRFFPVNIVPISSFQADLLNRYPRFHLVKVIPFGVDTTLLPQMKYERTIDILAVGSLNTIKNYPEFVEVIRSLRLSFPSVRCQVIGEGSERSSIERLIAEHKLEEMITLRGELSYSETMKVLQSGKILLHTSLFEGQALVITEALAAGLYVVCHPTGIATSLHSGKLFTGVTKEDLIQHLLRLLQLEDPDFLPEIHFTIEDTCRNYSTIFQTAKRM